MVALVITRGRARMGRAPSDDSVSEAGSEWCGLGEDRRIMNVG